MGGPYFHMTPGLEMSQIYPGFDVTPGTRAHYGGTVKLPYQASTSTAYTEVL